MPSGRWPHGGAHHRYDLSRAVGRFVGGNFENACRSNFSRMAGTSENVDLLKARPSQIPLPQGERERLGGLSCVSLGSTQWSFAYPSIDPLTPRKGGDIESLARRSASMWQHSNRGESQSWAVFRSAVGSASGAFLLEVDIGGPSGECPKVRSDGRLEFGSEMGARGCYLGEHECQGPRRHRLPREHRCRWWQLSPKYASTWAPTAQGMLGSPACSGKVARRMGLL